MTAESQAPNLAAAAHIETVNASIATGHVESAFDDASKAVFGAAAVFLYWLIVALIWLVEEPVFGRHQLTGEGLAGFTVGALVVIVWFCLLAIHDKLGNLLDMLRRATRSNADEPCPAPVTEAQNRPPAGIAANPWIPVTLTFLLAGWLIYVSGGITNSPYGQIPVAIVLIGQNVYKLPGIEYDMAGRLFGLPSLLRGVGRLYWYPISLVTLILTGVTMLQSDVPVVEHTAPAGQMLLTTLLTLVLCVCVTFVARHADRRSMVNDRHPVPF